MKRRIMTLVTAFAAALSGGVLVAAPSASADGLSNPSGTLTLSCPGAEAFIQVDWKDSDQVTVRWRLDDTGKPDVSPVLRIQAHSADHTAAPFIFPGDNAYFVLRGGNGHHEVGLKSDWNPADIPNINHLLVKLQNGTTEQRIECTQERNIFNWSRIAYKNALGRQGADYVWGGLGPGYDCSGLVLTSYNPIGNFPGWNVDVDRTAEEIHDWAAGHTSPSKMYAKRIPRSDLKVGDLLFFRDTNPEVVRDVEHVAFWHGDDRLYDAHQVGTPVGAHAFSAYWASRLVDAYRILGVSTVS